MDTWLLLVLMSLAVYRLTRLVVEDVFPPVLWVRDRLVGGWREPTSKEQHHDAFPRGEVEEGVLRHVDGLGMFTLADGELQIYRRRSPWSPQWLADLLSCPFCASGWIAVGVTGGVWAWLSPSVPLVLLLWLAAWALGGLLAAQEWA
jgi:hypothetical protein